MIEYIYLYHRTHNSRPKGPDDPDGEVLLSVYNPVLVEPPKMTEFALLKGLSEFLGDLGGSSTSLRVTRPQTPLVVAKDIADSGFVLVAAGENAAAVIDEISDDFSLVLGTEISMDNYQQLLPFMNQIFNKTKPGNFVRGVEYAPVDRLTFLEVFGFLSRLREAHPAISAAVFYYVDPPGGVLTEAQISMSLLSTLPLYLVAGDLPHRVVAGLMRGLSVHNCQSILLRPGFLLILQSPSASSVSPAASARVIFSTVDSLDRAAVRMKGHFLETHKAAERKSSPPFLYVNSVNLALRKAGSPLSTEGVLDFAARTSGRETLALRNLGVGGRTWEAIERSLYRSAFVELCHCRGLVDAKDKLDLWHDQLLSSVFMV